MDSGEAVAKVILPESASWGEVSSETDRAKTRAIMAAARRAGHTGYTGYVCEGATDTDGNHYLLSLTQPAYRNPFAVSLGDRCTFSVDVTWHRDTNR